MFQPSPGPKPGRDRNWLPTRCAVRRFQPSPGPKPGRDASTRSDSGEPSSCFNPRPGRSPGATARRVGERHGAGQVSTLARAEARARPVLILGFSTTNGKPTPDDVTLCGCQCASYALSARFLSEPPTKRPPHPVRTITRSEGCGCRSRGPVPTSTDTGPGAPGVDRSVPNPRMGRSRR